MSETQRPPQQSRPAQRPETGSASSTRQPDPGPFSPGRNASQEPAHPFQSDQGFIPSHRDAAGNPGYRRGRRPDPAAFAATAPGGTPPMGSADRGPFSLARDASEAFDSCRHEGGK